MKTIDLLNELYGVMEGLSAILKVVYQGLQESDCDDSIEMASVIFVVQHTLNNSVHMIEKTEESLDILKRQL